jgi:6-phosphogluconate dehydrogenase
MSATMEHSMGTGLPTAFYKAELDYFGSNMFGKRRTGDEEVKKSMEGKHHFEWETGDESEGGV